MVSKAHFLVGVLALVACSSSARAADEANDPDAILRAATDLVKNAKSFTAEMDLEVKVGLPGLEHGKSAHYEVAAERPNRFLILRTDGDLGGTVASDGEKMVQYMSELRQYTESEAPKSLDEFSTSVQGMMLVDGGMGGFMMALLSDDPLQRLTGQVTSSKNIGIETFEGSECHHLKFIAKEWDYDIWVTTGDKPIIRRILPDVSKQLGEEEKELGYTVQISFRTKNWEFDPELADETFVFAPPASAELVESFTPNMPGPVEPPVVTVNPLIGQPAPTFALVKLDGDEAFSLKDAIGKQVIVLDFWATWCPPCVAGLPQLAEVAADFKGKPVGVYAVNLQEDVETIQKFLKDREIEINVLRDPEASVAEKYDVSGIPQTVLIGLDGRVHVVHVGLPNDLKGELTESINALLNREDLAAKELAKQDRPQTEPTEQDSEAEPASDEPANDEKSAADEQPAETP